MRGEQRAFSRRRRRRSCVCGVTFLVRAGRLYCVRGSPSTLSRYSARKAWAAIAGYAPRCAVQGQRKGHDADAQLAGACARVGASRRSEVQCARNVPGRQRNCTRPRKALQAVSRAHSGTVQYVRSAAFVQRFCSYSAINLPHCDIRLAPVCAPIDMTHTYKRITYL